MTIKGYITNLGKYNEGELVGEWIEFPIDEDELDDVLERIGIDGVRYEEYFFTDWETDLENLDLGEYESIDKVNEIAEKVEEWDEDTLSAALEIWWLSEVLDMDPDDMMLLSHVTDDGDLGYYYAVECGCLDIPESIENYFDFDSYGSDIRINTNGGHTRYGWVEYLG